MRIKPSLRGLTIVSLLFVVLYAVGISTGETNAGSSQVAVPPIEKSLRGRDEFGSKSVALSAAPLLPLCPGPSVKLGDECVLNQDVKLTQTLVLLSNTTLNCQGHKLTPKVGSPVTLPPQVGIFLNSVKKVVIKGCVIDGFDFGIFAINSQLRDRFDVDKPFVITDNTIKARYTGVSIISVDNAEVSNNDISYTRAAGRALYVGRNSDLNKIRDNTFTSDLVLGTNNSAFRVPGPKSAANPEVIAPTNLRPGSVVVITEIEGAEPTLLNAVIEKQLFQLKTTNQLTTSLTGLNSEFSEANDFERNTIRFSPLPVGSLVPVDGIVLAVPQGTIIRNNNIEGEARAGLRLGIRVGMQNGINRKFPGKCNLKSERSCLDDAGCNIPGVDTLVVGQGDVCSSPDLKTVSWISRDTVIEGNEITGPFTNGINTAGHRTTIMGNKINGGSPATGIGIGLVGKHGIETTTVTHNSVSNVAVALNLVKSLQDLEASSFESKISLNDFTRYKTAVLTSKFLPTPPILIPTTAAGFYNLSSDLSVVGQGNFWGILICPGFDPAKVVRGEDAFVNHSIPDLHHVTDSHAFSVAVARTPPAQLLGPCF